MLNHKLKTTRIDGNKWRCQVTCDVPNLILNHIGVTKANAILKAEKMIARHAATEASKKVNSDAMAIYVFPMSKGVTATACCEPEDADHYNIMIRSNDLVNESTVLEYEELTQQQMTLVRDAFVEELGFPVEDFS